MSVFSSRSVPSALSRRRLLQMSAGAGAAAAMTQLGRSASLAQTSAASPYRAMIGVFLFGGNDAWNMVVPTDSNYAAYASARGAQLALAQSALTPLTGTAFGLHPSFAPLNQAWADGALSVMLNTGSLYAPLTKTLYQQHPELRPLNLMSHADEQNHWQGTRMRDVNTDGFMGRINDKAAPSTVPSLISVAGSTLALIGDASSPLVLPSTGGLVRNGFVANSTDSVIAPRQAALAAFGADAADGQVTDLTAQAITSSYAQASKANTILTSASSSVDQHFKNPINGAVLTSDIAHQLLRAARMIEARGVLGQAKQVFFVSQGGYDTHSDQVDANDTATGVQAGLYADLAMALAAFYNATKALGVASNVTTFTMSDFGRVYKANAQRGTDHAWGSNHLVMGGALKPQTLHGAYPSPVLGGPDDAIGDGRWIPTTAIEEYLGAIALWYGVAEGDMPYVFPNWTTWSTNSRGPAALFA